MAWVLAVLNALAAIPSIVGYVEKFCAAVVGWWIERQKKDALAAIADAAAAGARASTQEERLHAAELWRTALSKPRTTE